jgi:hypothetical protein
VSDSIAEIVIEAFGNINGRGNHSNFEADGAHSKDNAISLKQVQINGCSTGKNAETALAGLKQ